MKTPDPSAPSTATRAPTRPPTAAPPTTAPPTTAPTTPTPARHDGSDPARPLPALRRAGGLAALAVAGTYVVGFGVIAAYLAPRGYLDTTGDPAASLAFLLEHQVTLYLWHLVLYLVGGVVLAVLVVAVHDRLRVASPALAQVTTGFGLIWSGLLLASGMIELVGQRTVVDLAATDTTLAVSTWSAVGVVAGALGGGIELVGAVWVLLACVAALRSGAFNRGLAVLGIVVGVAGLGTLVPQLGAAAAVFGLGFIVWFVWAGVAMLRR